jgi:nicotinate-nucleotide pyrophosphorylase (carboxylating)
MVYSKLSQFTVPDQNLLLQALKEDIPNGDLTTQSLGLKSKLGKVKLIAKEDLVISGIDYFLGAMAILSPQSEYRLHFRDGQKVLNRQVVCEIKGNLIEVLQAERVGLNYLGFLSGIASFTRCYVDLVSHTNCKILDTRKTIPLYRDLCKKAVRDGGGTNHRRDLSSAVLLKENHLRSIDNSISKAVSSVKKHYQGPIEVEVTNLDEVSEAVHAKVQRIMLDNMSNDMMMAALKIIPSEIETEASGNMNLERVKSVAELGVTYISVGAITHSAPNADFSLLFDWSSE